MRKHDKRCELPVWRKQFPPEAYLKAHNFLTHLNESRRWVTAAEYKELREQALSGDVMGAWSRMNEIMNTTRYGRTAYI